MNNMIFKKRIVKDKKALKTGTIIIISSVILIYIFILLVRRILSYAN